MFRRLITRVRRQDEFEAVVFKDDAGGWRFRIVARNHEIVAQSESYVRRIDAEEMAVRLARGRIVKVEVRTR